MSRARIVETHSGGVIKIELAAGTWGRVPHGLLEDSRINLDSRAVAAWLATRPEAWQISVFYLCKSLNLGRDRWRRIAHELEAVGYLTRSCSPTGSVKKEGRNYASVWVWEITFCAVPKIKGGDSSIDRAPIAGFPGNGTPGDEMGGDKNKMNKNKLDKPKRGGARWGCGESHFKIDKKTGIHYNPIDARDRDSLLQISQYAQGVIAEAVFKAKSSDDQSRAFPSTVLRILKRPSSSRTIDTPAWARGSSRHSRDPSRTTTVFEIIDGEMSWK